MWCLVTCSCTLLQFAEKRTARHATRGFMSRTASATGQGVFQSMICFILLCSYRRRGISKVHDCELPMKSLKTNNAAVKLTRELESYLLQDRPPRRRKTSNLTQVYQGSIWPRGRPVQNRSSTALSDRLQFVGPHKTLWRRKHTHHIFLSMNEKMWIHDHRTNPRDVSHELRSLF